MPIGQNFVGGLRTGLSAAQLAEDNKAEAARQRQQNMIEIGKKMQSDLQGVATTYEQKRKELQDKLDIETIPEVKAKYQREMQGLDLSLDKFKSHELTYWEDLQKSGVPASVLPPRFAIETLGGTPLSSKQEAQQAAQAEATKTISEKRAALPFVQQEIRDRAAEQRRTQLAAAQEKGRQDRETAELKAQLKAQEGIIEEPTAQTAQGGMGSAIQQDVLSTSGPLAQAEKMVSKALGFLVPGINPKLSAESRVEQFNKVVTEAGLVSNPKFPVKEMERVRSLQPDPKAWLTDPEFEAEKIYQMKVLLDEMQRTDIEMLNSGRLSRKGRDNARDRIGMRQQVLDLMGDVQSVTPEDRMVELARKVQEGTATEEELMEFDQLP